jgi:hypothetical protein
VRKHEKIKVNISKKEIGGNGMNELRGFRYQTDRIDRLAEQLKETGPAEADIDHDEDILYVDFFLAEVPEGEYEEMMWGS